MRCRDGTRLISRLWHPPETTGRAPVLLMRQPYGRAIASTVTYAHPHWYASQGFLVVVQDVRGRGASEGEFRGFAQEASDGADAVRWARQLPEGNGRVGMYGFSYQGLTQLLNDGGGEAEAEGEHDSGNTGRTGRSDAESATISASLGRLTSDRHDPLPDCMAPAMCGLDERLHWASEGGAHWWALGLGWALQLAAQGLARRGDREGWQEIRRSLSSGTFLEQGLTLLQRHDGDGMGLRWLQRPAGPGSEPEWTIHAAAAALLRRPMLLLGGWWDPHLRGVLDLWQRSRQAGGQPGLWIGPWSHLNWSQGQPLPAGAGSIDQLQVQFFRRHLAEETDPEAHGQGQEGTAEPAATEATEAAAAASLLFDLGSGHWQKLAPTEVTGGIWRLQSAGLAAMVPGDGRLLPLLDDPAAAPETIGAGPTWLVHDPWRPLPGRGGSLGLDAGPCRREDLDARSDVACFNSAVLEQPLTLQGEPCLELVVIADQPGFDLCCALSVLRPAADGAPGAAPEAHQLSTGLLRVLGADAQRRERRQVRFQPLLATLRPGEQLRLSVAASAWPQVAVNPGTGEQPRGGAGPEHRVITLTLELAGSRLSMNRMVGSD